MTKQYQALEHLLRELEVFSDRLRGNRPNRIDELTDPFLPFSCEQRKTGNGPGRLSREGKVHTLHNADYEIQHQFLRLIEMGEQLWQRHEPKASRYLLREQEGEKKNTRRIFLPRPIRSYTLQSCSCCVSQSDRSLYRELTHVLTRE
jgi:hypothetical protein